MVGGGNLSIGFVGGLLGSGVEYPVVLRWRVAAVAALRNRTRLILVVRVHRGQVNLQGCVHWLLVVLFGEMWYDFHLDDERPSKRWHHPCCYSGPVMGRQLSMGEVPRRVPS